MTLTVSFLLKKAVLYFVGDRDIAVSQMSCCLLIKAEKLREQWEEGVRHVTERKNELDDMLLECRQLDEMYAEFERWLGQIEEDVAVHPVKPTASNIDQQIARQKVGQFALFIIFCFL